MQFTTKIPISKSRYEIGYESEIISFGSCFAVNIAEKLTYFKFQHSCNPFGILFHPLAVLEIMRRALSDEVFTDRDVFEYNGLWHCFDTHSDASNPYKETLLSNLNHVLQSTKKRITTASHIIITYGTSWAYRTKQSDKLVANCHKLPQSHFEKELLPIETVADAIRQTLTLIENRNPNAVVIFTVSPVRHIKDGFVENQRSKAHLIAAIHQQLTAYSSLATEYFPSYEIMMDELRDYRFYAGDMLHPNQTAIDYIWQRFAETYISEAASQTMEEVAAIQKALRHKPFHPDSESHQQFLAKLYEKIAALQKQFPQLQF